MSSAARVHILAISGSLRQASANRALVEAAAQLAAEPVEVVVYRELEQIPPFNPDLDELDPPASVGRFRAALQACDGVLISSPEYAHGVSGVMKNALDWVVGSGELVDKPVALINASARATHAHVALMETLTVMSAQIAHGASITVPVQGRGLDARGIAVDPALSVALRAAVNALASAARDALPRGSDAGR
jgi:NAD(P)H-dependent FMN reductase